MKLKLHKRKKCLILVVIGLLSILCLVQAFLINPKKAEKRQTVIDMEYTNHLEVLYKVNLLPNKVYTESSLEEGFLYTKKLLDTIVIEFNDSAECSLPCVVTAQYQIKAIVTGSKNEGESTLVYWKKEYPLIQKTELTKEEGALSFQETLSLKLDQYEAFARLAQEETGMQVSSQLKVLLEGTIKIQSEYGKKTIPLTAGITVPLQESSFKITKSEPSQVVDYFTHEIVLPQTEKTKRIIFYLAFFLLLVISFFICLFRTRDFTEGELKIEKINKIIKIYGTRLIGLRKGFYEDATERLEVHEFEDLLKIADEVQKPIFYNVEQGKQDCNFYFGLADQDTLYVFYPHKIWKEEAETKEDMLSNLIERITEIEES